MESRLLLSTIPLPTIPAGVFNVANYGAIANGSTDNTTAIQAAINAASAAGGGTVEIPAAAKPYESGPLTLKNSINLQIDSGATLQMLPYGTYPLVSGATSYANFIYANTLQNVEVSGGGTIDGQGSAWWTAFNAGQISATRPAMLAFSTCTNVLVTGVTLTNAPNVHLSFNYINTNVTVNGITINTPNSTPNTDGIDCTGVNVLIENSSISDGDDNIAFGGRGSSNLTVTGCSFGTGHGLSIGSYTDSGGLNGLTVTNCTFNGTLNGIHGKTNRTRGGVVQNLTYSNLVMTNVTYPILFDDYYGISPHPADTDPAQAVTSETPYWNNVSITNVYSTGSTYPIDLWGLPEAPLNTFTLSGVTSIGTGGTYNVINNATGVKIINSVLSPAYTNYNAGITTTAGGPTISTAAAAGSTTVTTGSTTLSVLGSDPAGATGLTYTWASLGNAPAPVAFNANGTNAAKNTTATFTKAGTYVFQVVATDPSGLTTTSAVTVTVAQTASSITVTPASSSAVPSAAQTISAVELDQFGNPMSPQPTFTWSASVGSVTSAGVYTAPIADARDTVTATAGTLHGSASVNVAVLGTVVWTVNPALAASTTNFQTISAAIAAVPTGNITPYDIQIAPGTYSERLNIPAGDDFITLDGGSGGVTVQAGSDETGVALATIASNNFTAANVTFNDNAGQTAGPNNAILDTGDRQIFLNDSIEGYQDTLFLNKGGARSYFQNCTISGDVDFIYGAGTGVFNQCNITQRVGGVSLTAPATPQSSLYGLVFINSHLVNGGSITAGTTALARAWTSPYGASAYLDCNMDNMISTAGWTNFSATTSYTSTERYDEYDSYGAGAAGYLANPSQRASQAVSLSATQAALYANLTTWKPNFANLFNGWDPTALGGDVPVVYTGTSGVWETATNWNIGAEPSAGQAVFVRSGTVTLSSTDSIDSLTLGTSGAGATLTISSGASLSVGGLLSTIGTSSTPSHINDAGSLIAATVVINDTSDQVHITSNAGFTVTQSLTGAWPAGTVYADQGVLSVPNLGSYASGPIIDVGAVSGETGTWNVTSGQIQYPQAVNTGSGIANINITGGTINGTYGPSFGAAGSGGTVTMTQTGGTASFLNANLGDTKGTYVFNDSGGTLQGTGTSYDWLLGDGSGALSTWNTSASAIVALNDLYIGRQGTGTFNQTGGTVTLNQTSAAQIPADAGLRLGWSAGGSGAYVISGGSLLIDNGGITLGYDPASGTSYGIGTLHIEGGAAGAIGVIGNYQQSSKSVLEDDVQSTGISTLNITGNVTFTSGATVLPTLVAGVTPGSYTLMTWTGTLTGTPTLAAAAVNAGWTLKVVNNTLVATNTLPPWLSPTSVASWNIQTNTLTVSGAAAIIADPGTTGTDSEPNIVANGNAAVLAIAPTGSNQQIHIGGLTLTGGAKLTFAVNGSVPSALFSDPDVLVVGAPGSSTAPTFNVDSTSTLDLKNNDMIITGGGASELSIAQSEITSGYANGAETGAGIISSSAAGSGSFGLGYDTGADYIAANGTSTFDGQTITSGCTLVKYTLLGDATLSGAVGLVDYNRVLANYNTGTTWAQGAFHPGKSTGLSDYNAVLANFGQGPTASIVRSSQMGGYLVGGNVGNNLNTSRSVSNEELKLVVNTITGDVSLMTSRPVDRIRGDSRKPAGGLTISN